MAMHSTLRAMLMSFNFTMSYFLTGIKSWEHKIFIKIDMATHNYRKTYWWLIQGTEHKVYAVKISMLSIEIYVCLNVNLIIQETVQLKFPNNCIILPFFKDSLLWRPLVCHEGRRKMPLFLVLAWVVGGQIISLSGFSLIIFTVQQHLWLYFWKLCIYQWWMENDFWLIDAEAWST